MKSPFITRMKSKSGRTKTKFSTTVNSSKNWTGIMGGKCNQGRHMVRNTWMLGRWTLFFKLCTNISKFLYMHDIFHSEEFP